MDEMVIPTGASDTLEFELAAAQAAMGRGEHERALRIWEGLRDRYPTHPAAYRQAAAALIASGKLDDADAVLRAGCSRVTEDALLLAIDHARVAGRRHDVAEVASRWMKIREAYPKEAVAHVGCVEGLREAGRLEEAEASFAALIERFPNERAVPILRASLADARHNWAEASQLWENARERLPDNPVGYVKGARSLQQASRLDEAEALLTGAVTQFPDIVELQVQHAEVAARRQEWPAAIQRWTRVRELQPDNPHGYIQGAAALRSMGRLDEAQMLLSEATDRFPSQIGVSEQKLLTASAQLDMARALIAQGRLNEAEEMLRAGMQRFPQDHGLFMAYATVATRRHDWEEALRRWRDAQRRFPQVAEIRHRQFEAELRVIDAEPSEHPAPADSSIEPPVNMYEIITRFESLGGTLQGCEFGLVQRAYGAEPLGLLRWTEMAPKNVCEALEAEFEGVGLPENTELGVHQTPDGPEYFTSDKRFLMSMHTFVKESEVPHDKMFALCCRRLQFLREKLLDDLRGASKIFVYKITWRLMESAELERMHAALRRYGNTTLLYVQRALPEKPHGTVELVKPGLLMGYIDRFSVSATDEPLGPATESWGLICRHALALPRDKISSNVPAKQQRALLG